jgi:hypothetical protein
MTAPKLGINDLSTRPGFLLILWTAVLALPSAPVTYFDGLALSSVPEVVALAALLPLVLSTALRRALAQGVGRWPGSFGVALVAMTLVALTLKLALLAAPPVGFRACYESTLTPPPAGDCERSFENPFFRFGATRIDSRLDFDRETWKLSFFNSLRFNFDPFQSGLRRRDRLPFMVTWRGVVDSPGGAMAVTYAGEAIALIGAVHLELPPAYEELRTVRFELPPGRQSLRIRYTFEDESLTGGRIASPYATFRLTEGTEPGTPVRAAPPRPLVRVAALGLDGLGIGLSLALLGWYGLLLRRELRSVLFVVVTLVGVYVARPGLGLSMALCATAVSWALLGLILARNRSSRLLLSYFGFLVVGGWIASDVYTRVDQVAYRGAGEDWLTYESFARTILETWSLEGGEAVFYIQPLFRYVRFGGRLLLGDSDPVLHVLTWTALSLSIAWAAAVLLRSRRVRGARGAWFALAAAGTLALASSQTVVDMIGRSLSEHVTWIFLACAFALLGSRHARRWAVGAAALGAALITRPNQAPALLVTAVAFLGPRIRLRPRPTLAASGVLVAVCLLPLAHNLYYGGRAVVFTTTASHPAALGVPITTLVSAPSDAAARADLWTQLRGLLFISPLPVGALGGPEVGPVLRGLQAVWLAAIWMAFWSRLPINLKLLVFVPALYLVVHIVYDIRVYYPRHILAAYFAMGLVTMAAAAWRPSAIRYDPPHA